MKENEVTLRLSRRDAGQVLDGLTVCHENWRKTLDWYEGKLDDPDFVILECDDRDEAARMTEVYADLLESLEGQLLAGGREVDEGGDFEIFDDLPSPPLLVTSVDAGVI